MTGILILGVGIVVGVFSCAVFHFFSFTPRISESEEEQILTSIQKRHLPLPGQSRIIYTKQTQSEHDRENDIKLAKLKRLKVVSWNIERGYNLQGIISELKRINADIILLSEVDWDCKRTGSKHVLLEIAQALDMTAIYSTEFIEIEHKIRKAQKQGGGIHGNAILTRFRVKSFESQLHSPAFDWPNKGMSLKEPRLGGRVFVGAILEVPIFDEVEVQKEVRRVPVQVWSCHFENMCGQTARISQFFEVIERAKKNPDIVPFIGGDFNTEVLGVTRLSPIHCDNHLRFKMIGHSEASMWQSELFEKKSPYSLFPPKIYQSAELHLQRLTDPFHKDKDITSVRLYGLYQAKLDWLLTEALIEDFNVEPDRGFSDHQMLWLEAKILEK